MKKAMKVAGKFAMKQSGKLSVMKAMKKVATNKGGKSAGKKVAKKGGKKAGVPGKKKQKKKTSPVKPEESDDSEGARENEQAVIQYGKGLAAGTGNVKLTYGEAERLLKSKKDLTLDQKLELLRHGVITEDVITKDKKQMVALWNRYRDAREKYGDDFKDGTPRPFETSCKPKSYLAPSPHAAATSLGLLYTSAVKAGVGIWCGQARPGCVGGSLGRTRCSPPPMIPEDTLAGRAKYFQRLVSIDLHLQVHMGPGTISVCVYVLMKAEGLLSGRLVCHLRYERQQPLQTSIALQVGEMQRVYFDIHEGDEHLDPVGERQSGIQRLRIPPVV